MNQEKINTLIEVAKKYKIDNPRDKVYDLLVELCNCKTWVGVNKHEVRGIFQCYARRIDEIYANS